MTQIAQDVLDYWFKQLEPRDWWRKSDAIDAEIERLFGATLAAARRGELWAWRDHARGRLAEIIVLDQFSRHLFRDSAEAFAADGMALVLAQEAVRKACDRDLEPAEKAFLYLPYMHSESRLIHVEAMRLFDQPGLEHNLKFEIRHKEIIDRFGRYPHRNAALGRASTPEEEVFLTQPGSRF